MKPKRGAASGFDAVKKRLLSALIDGNYQHEARDRIDIKNHLLMGRVITVHVLKTTGWYIKFYFLDPSTVFISVHLEGQS